MQARWVMRQEKPRSTPVVVTLLAAEPTDASLLEKLRHAGGAHQPTWANLLRASSALDSTDALRGLSARARRALVPYLILHQAIHGPEPLATFPPEFLAPHDQGPWASEASVLTYELLWARRAPDLAQQKDGLLHRWPGLAFRVPRDRRGRRPADHAPQRIRCAEPRAMSRRSLPFVLLALAATTGACHVETAARGSTAPAAAVDGGEKPSKRKPEARAAMEPYPAPDAGSGAKAGASVSGDDEVVDLSEPVLDLTRAQVRARRGPPTEIRGNDWIYTPPEQEGCRDVIISEVLTFKGGVVGKFHLQRRQTGKVCRRR